jgi:peptide-methionine (R)-S-oxide reductase
MIQLMRIIMYRRNFLATLAAAPLALWGAHRARDVFAAAGKALTPADITALQNDWKTLLAANADVAMSAAPPLNLSSDEWKKRLPRESYQVLREEGTERPGSSPLNNEKRPGVFVCSGCSLPVFTSAMKFDSGTGWPSFFTMIPAALIEKSDYKLIVKRTEYHCARCGGHHGHVFDDGPAPTNLRYCNNGVSLRFIPKNA